MNATRIISPRVSPKSIPLHYHGGVVYVRTDAGGRDEPRAVLAEDLAAEGGTVAVSAETRVASAADGPFEPLAIALERDAALRDDVTKALPVPSLVPWLRERWVVLAIAALPLGMLVELDRELVSKDALGAGRLLVDVLLAAWVIVELTRRTPRLPSVAAAAMLAVSMRWVLVVTRLCGKGVHVIVWCAALLAVAAGLAILARAPSRSRVALEIMGKLGIERTDVLAVKSKALGAIPPNAVVAAAVAGAAGLPLLLFVLRKSDVGVWPRAAAFLGYAAIVPLLVRRLDRDRPVEAVVPARATVRRTLFAIALGVTLVAALLHGTHQFFDAGGELARCTGRLDDATRRLLVAEAAELSRRVAAVRGSTVLVLMTTALMPLAEERIFRGLLMNVLVRRYGSSYGLFAAAAAFGVAHVGIYEIALYQTVLLGIGFGIAYAEGGLVAAFVVHAVWNLLNVA